MEDYKVLTSIKGIHSTVQYPELMDIPVSEKRIIDLVRENAEREKYVLDDEVEIIVPSANNNGMKRKFINVASKEGVSKVVNTKKYTIYDDFWSFKGQPYTKEADNYLNTFNRFYVKITGEGTTFAVWYRNTYSE